MSFTCQVCFEQQSKRFPLPKLATGNGDVLREADCEHPICQTCLATFVTSRVQEQMVSNVRCPFGGCTNQIFEQDVKRMVSEGIVTSQISERFAELRTSNYTARAESLSETLTSLEESNDFELILKLWHSTRLCPRCSLVIEKSQGCNSFFCICGHHFHYDSAPRIVGKGIKNYDQVVSVARSCGLTLEDAQKYGGESWRKERALACNRLVDRVVEQTRLSRDAAWELLQQAKLGDQSARERIRCAKEVTAEEEDREPYFDLWENSLDDTDELQARTGKVGAHVLQEASEEIVDADFNSESAKTWALIVTKSIEAVGTHKIDRCIGLRKVPPVADCEVGNETV